MIEQTNRLINFTIPAGTLAPHGGYLVVARNATKTAFQTLYGKTLGSKRGLHRLGSQRHAAVAADQRRRDVRAV
jgi:hypothetical protein